MDLVLMASVACGLFYRSYWRQPVLPVIGVVLAVIYGLWRGGVGGAVFGALGVAVNVWFLVWTVWWERRRSTRGAA